MKRIGGASVNDHLAVIAKRRGKKVKREAPPPLPMQAERTWTAFVDLSGARQVGMTLQPITYSEIAAYQLVTRRRLTGWEVDQVRMLDDLYLKTVEEQEKKGQPRHV